MAIRWNFRQFLASKHQIYTATALRRHVVEKTGMVISVAQLCNLVNGKPKLIRLETAEILCSALACSLSDFLDVTPKQMDPTKKKKLSYKNTPHSKIAVSAFPKPEDYQAP